MFDTIITQADVDRGAALLDEALPTWYRFIDRDDLDLASPTRCVLGQLGHSSAARHGLHFSLGFFFPRSWRSVGKRIGCDTRNTVPGTYGFDAAFYGDENATRLWGRTIQARLDREATTTLDNKEFSDV